MQTIDKIKEQVYLQVQASGFLKNVQASVKAHVLQIIQRQTQANKNKLGFKYQHPLLKKLQKYQLTSLCLDLIQEFLQSFKFQHTLNVFRKQINKTTSISRNELAQHFKIQLKNQNSQAVMLSLVQQLVNGDIKMKPKEQPRVNNFINKNIPKQSEAKQYSSNGQQQKQKQNKKQQPINQPKKQQPKSFQQDSKQGKTQPHTKKKQAQQKKQAQKKKPNEKKIESEIQESGDSIQEPSIPVVQEKQKPKEQATDLLGGVLGKFQFKKKEKSPDQQFEARRAYSAPKQKKAPPPQSGTNKIRGISAGKGPTGFLSKFTSFANQANNSSAAVDQQLDQFQQSKDSTRRNPLFSSSQSGFDKSGYDQSVDEFAIEDQYEYVEKAKKMFKKP